MSSNSKVANQKYWLNLKELAPKLSLKQNTKKAQKSALIGADLSQKSVPELISAGYEEESSSDESEDDEIDDMDDDMDDDEEMEVDASDVEEDEEEEESDDDSDSDSDDKPQRKGGISFVPRGKIEGVNMSAQNLVFRQKLLERINQARKHRKAAPISEDGTVLVEEKPFSKRMASKEKKKSKTGEPELSKRQLKNQKKRLRKEEALKAAPKHPHVDPYAKDSDSDEDQKPIRKKPKVVEENLEFGKMRFEDGHAKSHYEQMQTKGLTKEKQLAKLEKEKQYEKKLQGTEEGERLKEEKAWSKAIQRVEGEKVKDRADLLRKAIKREESAKKKSKKEWSERKSAVKASQEDRIKKRNANIKERIETHKLKKIGKKAPKKKK